MVNSNISYKHDEQNSQSVNICAKLDSMCFCEVHSFPRLNDKPFKNKNENSNSYYNNNTSSSFKIYHQDIRCLKNKINEFTSLLFPEYPHILCLTEHHLRDNKIDMISLEHYKLATKFCRQKLKKWGSKYFCTRSYKFYRHRLTA
jgi:hypothetical protein